MRIAASALLAAAVCMGLARAQGRPPGAAGGRKPSIIAFASDGGAWVWLKQAGGEVELYRGGAGSPRSLVARGQDWREVALLESAAWLLQRPEGASRGALLRADLAGGSAPAPVLGDLDNPTGLRASGGRLFWIETGVPALPGLPFLPAAGPMARLRCREASGQVRSLAEWSAGTAGPGDVTGLAGDAAYVRVRRPVSTEFLRVPLAGGLPTRVCSETGGQQALLWRDGFYWSAISDEAPGVPLICVRRVPVGRGAAPETVCDWLPPRGTLLGLRDGLYFVSNSLYRLPGRLAPPQELRPAPDGPAATDGSVVVLLGEREGPEVVGYPR
jgi:hypothetical protein